MKIIDYLLGKNYIKIKIRNYDFEIFYRPGLWMPDIALKVIQDRIKNIAMEAYKRTPTTGIYVDTALMCDKIIILCTRNGRDCAFNAITIIGRYEQSDVLYTGPGCSTPRSKAILPVIYGIGFSYIFFKNKFKKIYVACMTHVPRVFGLMIDSFINVYPNLDKNAVPEKEHIEVKDMLVNTYVKEIEPDYEYKKEYGFILKKLRMQKDGTILPRPDTKNTVPKYWKKDINERCIELLEYDKGDAVVQVGILDYRCCLKAIMDIFRKKNAFAKIYHNILAKKKRRK